MKHSKLFVTIILIAAAILLALDLPFPFIFSAPIPNLPFVSSKNAPSNTISFPLIKPYRLGLDLDGGVSLTYDLDMKNIQSSDRQSALESTRSVIERRINTFGVSEPVIQTLKVGNNYRIVVELPGVTNVTQAVDLIGKTAQLSFWEETNQKLTPKEATSSAYPVGMALVLGTIKPNKTALTGKDLKSATAGVDSQSGQPQVQLTFTPTGTKLFANITKRNLGKPVVIVLDNQVIEAPTVQSTILNGDASITGGFTTDTANNLAIALNAGALPVPLDLVAQTNVQPSLGIASLKTSLVGGILGFLAIIVFMSYLYRKEGILASGALVIYTIFTLFIFKMIPVTLTLAGIAGFILSVGMAVDANILIFERMKEEKRAGKSQPIAIEQGFKRAWSSIRDSNVSSLITCLILFIFGTGEVRGFALTLAIGILVSMFSAITITRNFLRVFDKNAVLKK